jgi:1-acyl-sn-glycerol-3-phosphate acyltransferase
MLVLRSVAFNVLFYINLVIWLIAALPTLLMPFWGILRVAQAWGRFNMWLMRVVVGTRVEFRGLERIPAGGFLLAAKHQSFWETFTLLTLVDKPAFILKRELTWIPVFGWLAIRAGMIAVNRGAGLSALSGMTRQAIEAVRRGRQIIIFPEGTRRPPGAPPAYKFGVAHLYRQLGVPCVPVALNSGLFWPRRQFIRRPGTILVEILPPIAPGLPRDAFFDELREAIEAASNRLLVEAGGVAAPPVVKTATPQT